MVADLRPESIARSQRRSYKALLLEIIKTSRHFSDPSIKGLIKASNSSIDEVRKIEAYVEDARAISQKGGYEGKFEMTHAYRLYRKLC